jgi:DHA2 family multidrug resistance protein
VGKNVGKIDPRKLATVAFIVFAIVLYMRSRFTTSTDLGTIMIPTILQGMAMAFFFVPLQALIFSGLPPQRMPAAAGLSNFVRITAGAIGTSVFTTAWDNRAAMHHSELVESVGLTNPSAVQALGQLGNGGFTPEQALASVNRLVDQQAYTMAADDLFLISSVLFLALILLVWLTRPPQGGSAPVDAGGAH